MKRRLAGTISTVVMISAYLVFLVAMAELPELMGTRFGKSPWTIMVVTGMGLVPFIVALVFLFAVANNDPAD